MCLTFNSPVRISFAYDDSNQKPSNHEFTSPLGYEHPEGICDSGLLKKCLRTRNKSAEFLYSCDFKQV